MKLEKQEIYTNISSWEGVIKTTSCERYVFTEEELRKLLADTFQSGMFYIEEKISTFPPYENCNQEQYINSLLK